MKFGHLILAAALAFGLAGAASATPLANAAQAVAQPDTVVEFTKWKAKHGWKGHKGRHYGWNRGRHRGWYKHRHRAYYAPPRRHYGWQRGRHHGWYKHRRPVQAVYFRF